MKRNRKTINRATLEKWGACSTVVKFWQDTLNKEKSVIKCIQYCINNETHLNDANWLIVRCLSKKNAQRYAVYAAEQVLEIFETKHPNDDRPRKAIEAARAVIERDTEENRRAASYAADVADYAAYYAADAASYAACAAYYAADAAYYVAANFAADAAREEMQIKILVYGLELLNS